MKNLVRTRGGLVIHEATCRYAASVTAVPWKWAEDHDVEAIRWHVLRIGLKTCGHCKPLGYGRKTP